MAAAAAQYQPTGDEDVYPAGAHAIGHGGVHGEGGEGAEGDASQIAKRTSDWVQEGEEEQDEAKKARIDGEPGKTMVFTKWHACMFIQEIFNIYNKEQFCRIIHMLCRSDSTQNPD